MTATHFTQGHRWHENGQESLAAPSLWIISPADGRQPERVWDMGRARGLGSSCQGHHDSGQGMAMKGIRPRQMSRR